MRKRRALLYDDDPLVLGFFRDVFTSKGYEVLSFTKPIVCPIPGERDGACTNACADILLTDYRMPGKNGLDLISDQTAKECKIPIQNKAIMSGYVDEAFQNTLAKIGCACFQKPVILSEFYDWLRDCELRTDISRPLSTRRKEIRHATTCKIQFWVDRTGQVLEAMIVNMSDNGLCITLPSSLSASETIHIQTKPPLLSCNTASICWIAKSDQNFYQAGLTCH